MTSRGSVTGIREMLKNVLFGLCECLFVGINFHRLILGLFLIFSDVSQVVLSNIRCLFIVKIIHHL